MEIEFDEEKSAECLRKRGFDFQFAQQIFDDPDGVEYESTARDYGEIRWVRIGLIDGRLYTVIWTLRGNKRRIISARPSERKERKRYGKNH